MEAVFFPEEWETRRKSAPMTSATLIPLSAPPAPSGGDQPDPKTVTVLFIDRWPCCAKVGQAWSCGRFSGRERQVSSATMAATKPPERARTG